MIFLQPQVGKSLLISRMFPAWWLGKFPDQKIIASSYSVGLAEGFNTDCQGIMIDDSYGEIFKTTLPNRSSMKKRTQSHFDIENGQGYMYSVGVGGSTLGKTGDVFLIDDPIKGPQEAFSSTHRKKIIDWFNAVVETRMMLDGHVILMHQRWHKQDLAGFLLDQMQKTGEKWEVLYFPAVATEEPHPLDPRNPGEPLWPEFKGDKALWEQIRIKAGPYFWSSIYQQDPAGEAVALISKKDLRYYDPATMEFGNMEQDHSWDMNFKDKKEQAKGSYVVGQHWASDGHNYYIRDQVRGKWGFRETVKEFSEFYTRAPSSRVYIEDKANGPAILSTFEGIVPGLEPVEPKGDKFGRFAAISPLFHQGRVYLPDPDKIPTREVDGLNWVHDIITELCDFPNSPNDDQVDSCSQYLAEKWDPTAEGIFTPFTPTSPSKWSMGGLKLGKPGF